MKDQLKKSLNAFFSQSFALQSKDEDRINAMKTASLVGRTAFARDMVEAGRSSSLSQAFAMTLVVEQNKWETRKDKAHSPSDVFSNYALEMLMQSLRESVEQENQAIVGTTKSESAKQRVVDQLVEKELRKASEGLGIKYKSGRFKSGSN